MGGIKIETSNVMKEMMENEGDPNIEYKTEPMFIAELLPETTSQKLPEITYQNH